MSWLDDVLASLQQGGAPAMPNSALGPSPFPEPPKAYTPAEEAELAAGAREAAGQRLIRANQRRPSGPFGVPDMNSAGVQLALEQAPPGTGVPVAPGTEFQPFSIAPPSLKMAKEMAAPPPPATSQGGAPPAMMPPGSVPGMPAGPGAPSPPPPAATDVSAARRGAPMGPAPEMPGAPEKSFGDKLRELAPHMAGLAAGMTGEGWGLAARVQAQQQALGQTQQQANLTARALLARGAPAEEVAAAVRSPEMLKAMISKYFETGKPLVVGGHVVREKPGGGLEVLGDFSKDEKAPAGFEKKADGTLHFIKGGPADPDYLREKGEKNAAPTGYRWVDPKDPDKGLVAIPGGPGEKVTPEVSARLGLAKSFLGQLPDIKRDIEKGDATGPWDAAMAKAGVGRAGELRRQIESGAEALLRNLTGAGMGVSEAQKYVSRYELQPWDTTKTVRSKLDQLERELQHTITEVEKGRSPVPSSRGSAAPAAGMVDIGGQKIKWSVN
jgi:hypothetical protein